MQEAVVKSTLITGASAQLGKALMPLLLNDSHLLEGWSRSLHKSDIANLSWREVDLHSPPAIAASVGTLIHLAPLWLLPDLLRGAVAPLRVVAISSCSAKYKTVSPSAAEREVAQRLQLAEQEVKSEAGARGHQVTLLRPTMIYGIGADKTIAPMQRFIKRWRFIPLPDVAFGLRQPVHADDIAKAIMSCLESPVSIGQTYELGGGERLSPKQMAVRIFEQQGLRSRVIPIPAGLIAACIGIANRLGRNMAWNPALIERAKLDQVADNSDAVRDLKYRPRDFLSP